ncbi:hypothetical protein QBC40DRAFT_313700 [Triangularia verruculosa]|uniref:J domain-containing protein n=1 Tax=Triangularia verruculosa TaxID=2587418 RepID=A0AAN6X9G5_9PEZI|nr:hypothetical protein QBC40DRAFT_313700 [Triangularia verruculosa]
MTTESEKPRYYSLLGIRPDATTTDVKKGYRQMAREKHPDKHGNSAVATAEFQQLQQAYETISNPEARHEYDQIIAGELPNSIQRRSRYAGLFDRALNDSLAMQASFNYRARLVEALELRLRQKKSAHEAEQRRILDAQTIITISDDDSPEPVQHLRNGRECISTGVASEAEVIGEMPPQIVQELTLAKQDHQKAVGDMRDAEVALKRARDEMVALRERLQRSEIECAQLEREHNPRWRNEAVQISGQGSSQPYQSGPHATVHGYPSYHEAPQNVSPTSAPNGPYNAPPEQHQQPPRAYASHSGMPPSQWAYHAPPPPQQPWPLHQGRPEPNPYQSQFQTMKAEIERLNAGNQEKDRQIERLTLENLALANELVQRQTEVQDQANKQQAGSNDGTDSGVKRKRGRPRGSGRNNGETGERDPKAARRA